MELMVTKRMSIKRMPNGTIDFNWLIAHSMSPKSWQQIKLELIQIAEQELFDAVKQNYYGYEDLKTINYAEVCDWCGFPNFQDGGIFEQVIKIAANTVLGVLDYKPAHFID